MSFSKRGGKWEHLRIFPFFKVYTLDHFILCALDSRLEPSVGLTIFSAIFCLDWETKTKGEERSWREVFVFFVSKKNKTESDKKQIFAWKTNNWKLDLEFGRASFNRFIRKKLRQLHLAEVDGRSVVTLWDSKENFAPIFRFYCGCEAGNNLFPATYFFQLKKSCSDKKTWWSLKVSQQKRNTANSKANKTSSCFFC